MKKILLILVVVLGAVFGIKAQTTTYTLSATSTGCSNPDVTCTSGGILYHGDAIKLTDLQIAGNIFSGKVVKCNGTFGNEGWVNFREGVCESVSNNYNSSQVPYSAGDSEVPFSFSINSSFTSGSIYFMCALGSGTPDNPTGYFAYTGRVTLTATTSSSSCDAPTGLSSNNINDNSADIDWSSVSGVSDYTIKYKKTSSSSWTTKTANNSDYNITGLSSCTDYEYKVMTNCTNGGSSSYSSIKTFKTTGCSTPTYTISGYVRDGDGNKISNVTVAANNGGGSSTTGTTSPYSITVDEDWSGTITPSKSGCSFTPNSQSFSNVNNDRTFNFIADCGGTATPPNAPTGLSATTASSSSIDLDWNSSTGADDYDVYMDGSWKKTVTGTSTTVNGLSPSTEYCFTVRACSDSDGCSGDSSDDCATTETSGSAPVANFSASTTTPTEGDAVIFTNLSTGTTPMSYSWSFPGGIPNSSTSANPPTITYSSQGSYQVSLTVTNSINSDTETKSGYITVGLSPCNDLTLDIRICGDNTTGTSTNFQVSGNTHIGQLVSSGGTWTTSKSLEISNTVSVNTNTKKVSGNGLIKINNIPNRGTVNLYNGTYDLSYTGATDLLFDNNLNTDDKLFRFLGFKINYNGFKVLDDGVQLNGALLFLPDYLIPVGTGFATGGHFIVAPNIDMVSIRQSNGVQLGGEVLFETYISKKLYADCKISYDPTELILDGYAKFKLPFSPKLGFYMGLKDNKVNKVGFEIKTDHPFPLIYGLSARGGKLVLNNFQQMSKFELEMKMYNISSPLLLNTASFDVYTHFKFGSFFKAGVDGYLYKQKIIGGEIYVAKRTFKITASTEFIGVDYYENGSGKLKTCYVVDAFGTVGFFENSFSMGAGATITIPPLSTEAPMNAPRWLVTGINGLLGGNLPKELGETRVFANFDYGTFMFKTKPNFVPDIYLYANWNNNSAGFDNFQWATNYKKLPKEVHQHFTKNTVYQCSVENYSTSILIEGFNSNGTPEYNITLPNGDIVSNTNYTNYTNIGYLLDTNGDYSYFNIENAMPGDYLIEVISADSVNIWGANNPPSIKITDVNHNPSSKSVFISWEDFDHDNDAKVSLYYSRTNGEHCGQAIIKDISENNNTDNYTWNYSDLSTGTYYVYAVVEDEIKQHDISFSNEKITIINEYASNPPTNLTYSLTDTSIVLNWNKNNTNFNNYVVYYSDKENTLDFNSKYLSVGDTNYCNLTSIEPGHYYEIGITALDTAYNESDLSNIVSFVFNSNSKNNKPFFEKQDINTIAYVNENYNMPLIANDYDNDELTYTLLIAPENMSIDNSGEITWLPVDTARRINVIRVEVSDPYGLSDSLQFVIHVFDELSKVGNIRFNKAVYYDYPDRGIITIQDYDINMDKNKVDTIKFLLYSDSDLEGIQLVATELANNANEFKSIFNFSNSSTSGDNLLVTPGDRLYVKYFDNSLLDTITDYAHFTEFKSNFITGEVLCAGDSVQFVNKSTGSGMNYAWDFGDGNIADKRHPKHAFNPAPGVGAVTFDVTLTITDDEGRSSTKTQTISMYRKPLVDIGDNVEGCGFVNLDAQNIGSTYMWNTGEETQKVEVIADGIYNVSVTNEHGCVNTDEVNVTVLPVPSPDFSIQQHICVDSEEIDLAGNYDNAGTFAGTGISGFKFNPATAGVGVHEISYTYVNEHGCDATITKTIEVKPLPEPEFILFDYEICINDAINLSATPAGGSFIGTGVDNGIFSGILAGAGTQVVTYTYTDEFSCTNSVEQSITVYFLPEISFSGLQATYCANNQSSELIGVPEGGIFSGQGIYENTFSPSVAGAGVHTITYTYINPETDCENTATYQTTVNSLPEVEISSPTENICEDDNTIQVTGSPINGTFSGNAVNPVTGDFIPSQAEIGINTISYTLTNLEGCSETVSIDINVIERANAYISGDNTICLGEEATLIGSGGEEFLWNTNETTSTIDVSPVTTTEYSLTVSNSGMCEATNTHVLEVNTAENPVITQQGMLLSTETIANDYQWSLNNEEIQNANSQNYLATEFGDYFLTIWDDNNCIASSNIINVEETTDFSELQGVESITVLPNPNNGNFKIEFALSQTKDVELIIYDYLGKVVLEKSYDNLFNTSQQQIDIRSNPSGLYMVRIIIDNNIIYKKVVIR